MCDIVAVPLHRPECPVCVLLQVSGQREGEREGSTEQRLRSRAVIINTIMAGKVSLGCRLRPDQIVRSKDALKRSLQ